MCPTGGQRCIAAKLDLYMLGLRFEVKSVGWLLVLSAESFLLECRVRLEGLECR